MAVGDVVMGKMEFASSGGSWDIRPPEGEEWTISLLLTKPGTGWSVSLTNGSAVQSFLQDPSASGSNRIPVLIRITRDVYLRLYNNYAGESTYAYSGYKTKEGASTLFPVFAKYADPYGDDTIRPPVGKIWIVNSITASPWSMQFESTFIDLGWLYWNQNGSFGLACANVGLKLTRDSYLVGLAAGFATGVELDA